MTAPTSSLQAALYARVSSEQQTSAGTLASQLAALEERLQQDGLAVPPELRFLDDGYSGTTLVRPALERLRDAAANGCFDRLYVHSPDRLARKYAYQVVLVDELRRCGVELIFLNRALGQSPEDDLLLQVQGMVAEYERTKMLERSRRGKRHAAQRGSVNVLSAAPYGYRYVRKSEGGGNARYQVVLDEARVVRQIFAWVAQERCSLREVGRRLDRQNIPSPKGKNRWDARTIGKLLRNPAYLGTARYGRRRVGPMRPRLRTHRHQAEQPRRAFSIYPSEDGGIAIAVPALVDETLFAAVDEQLQENRRRARQGRRPPRHLLQGLVVCQQCGYACYAKRSCRPAANGQGQERVYYRCTGSDGQRFGGQRVCGNRQVRADWLDEAVWQDVCAWLNDPAKVAREYQRRRTPKEAADGSAAARTKAIQSVKRGIARLIDAYAEGLLEKAEFEPRLRSAKERLGRLEAEAQAETSAAAEAEEWRLVIGHLEAFAERVRDGLAEADLTTRRAIVRALVKRVEVTPEEVHVVYRVSPSPFAEGPFGGRWQDWGQRETLWCTSLRQVLGGQGSARKDCP
jgi:site-specific DNA recombinase